MATIAISGNPSTTRYEMSRGIPSIRAAKSGNRLAKTTESDGFLVLGAAETVVGLTDVFKPFPDRRGLYRPTGARAAPAKTAAVGGTGTKVAAMAGL
jgi:hypothetical protein